MSRINNKIEAHDRTVFQVLSERKYTVDYFQREYNWSTKHIEQLVTDLTSTFLTEYSAGDKREKGADYNNYYLGPFVVSEKDNHRSIIDGQQRLTSLTLFLIFLNHLQEKMGVSEKLESMIFSELRGVKSFNIQVEERTNCLENLFSEGEYVAKNGDDESTINMTERYDDITIAFPDEITSHSLPFFIDWMKYNVILKGMVGEDLKSY